MPDKKIESSWENIQAVTKRLRTVFDLIPPPPKPDDQFGHLMNTTHENISRLEDLANARLDSMEMTEAE